MYRNYVHDAIREQHMKIIHHFGVKISQEEDVEAFSAIGIQLDRGPANLPGSRIASFEIAEDDPRWFEAKRLAENCKITDFARTEFSDAELESADVHCIVASGHKGYPEPSDNMGYLGVTYDQSEHCSRCGIGLRQVQPFRIAFDPILKQKVLQLNWIFDEFFVSREVWAQIFEPLGIGFWSVLSSKTGEILDSVVQLQVSERADLEFEPEDSYRCPECGLTKFPLSLRGLAPRPRSIPAAIFRSTEFFGSGANAFNRVFVSWSVFKAIQRSGLRGMRFYPCSPALSNNQ
jgi:hypothetical protein